MNNDCSHGTSQKSFKWYEEHYDSLTEQELEEYNALYAELMDDLDELFNS